MAQAWRTGIARAVFVVSALVTLAACHPPRPEVSFAPTSSEGPPQPSSSLLCPSTTQLTQDERAIGGLTTQKALYYPATESPHFNITDYTARHAYTRLRVTTEVCSDKTLSPADRTAISHLLNALGLTNFQSFAASLDIAGLGVSGTQLPTLLPFTYTKDEAGGAYSVSGNDNVFLPWQVIPGEWTITFSYKATNKIAINASSLISSFISGVVSRNPTTTLLSPATKALIQASNDAVSTMLEAAFGSVTSQKWTNQVGPSASNVKGYIYRFRDSANRPLASVSVETEVTTSLVSVQENTNIPPKFSQPQDILGIRMGGSTSGSLLSMISNEDAYKHIIQSTANTDPTTFSGYCDDLQRALRDTYGLNIYDEALAMFQILYSSAWWKSDSLFNSNCFKNKSLATMDTLAEMGLPMSRPTTGL